MPVLPFQKFLFVQSSNNYNMKNTNLKCQQVLQLLLDINVLREDAYLFSKIALFQPEKKTRSHHYVILTKMEDERVKIQSQVEKFLGQIEINDFWKANLFQFSNKIYKFIKNFHQRLITLSSKLADISETNSFMQTLRNLCIEKLTESKNVGTFIHMILERLRQRVSKEFSVLTNFGINNKTIELAKREESLKNNRYLNMIKAKDSELFHLCHEKALQKIEADCKRILSRQSKSRNDHPSILYDELLDIQEKSYIYNTYQTQNGMMINLSYRQEGFCEFITTKYYRMIKDLLNKNVLNERSINSFRDKYNQAKIKIKKCLKSATVYDEHFKKSQRKSQISRQEESSNSLQMKNITNLVFQQKNEGITNQQDMMETPKKTNIFKIQKMDSRKKSHTLRPLAESKENNKEVVHQSIIEMKLEEQPHQMGKILRIRKKKHFPIFREENGWSLIVKQNASKISFLIH